MAGQKIGKFGIQIVRKDNLIKSIKFNNINLGKKGKEAEINPKENFEHLVWQQFFDLFLGALDESDYFGNKDAIYPYFLPSLIIESFIVNNNSTQEYNTILKKYIDSLNISKKQDESINKNKQDIQHQQSSDIASLQTDLNIIKTINKKLSEKKDDLGDLDELIKIITERKLITDNIGDKVLFKQSLTTQKLESFQKDLTEKLKQMLGVQVNKKPSDPKMTDNVNKKIQHLIFDSKSFFDLKNKLLTQASKNQELFPNYLNKGYVLHYLSTKGITPASQIKAYAS